MQGSKQIQEQTKTKKRPFKRVQKQQVKEMKPHVSKHLGWMIRVVEPLFRTQ